MLNCKWESELRKITTVWTYYYSHCSDAAIFFAKVYFILSLCCNNENKLKVTLKWSLKRVIDTFSDNDFSVIHRVIEIELHTIWKIRTQNFLLRIVYFSTLQMRERITKNYYSHCSDAAILFEKVDFILSLGCNNEKKLKVTLKWSLKRVLTIFPINNEDPSNILKIFQLKVRYTHTYVRIWKI